MKRSTLTMKQQRRLGIRIRVSLGVGTVAMVGPAWAAAAGHHGWPYAILPAACTGYAAAGAMRINRSACAQAKAEADAQRLAVTAEVQAWWDGSDGQPEPVTTITVVQVTDPTPDPLPRLELVQSFEEAPEMEPAL